MDVGTNWFNTEKMRTGSEDVIGEWGAIFLNWRVSCTIAFLDNGRKSLNNSVARVTAQRKNNNL
jgi:hypothetical protein